MDVTAVLATSATLGSVAEAFGVLENIRTAPIAAVSTHPASADQAAWFAALDGGIRERASPTSGVPVILTQPPVPFIGPQPSSGQVRTPVDELPKLRGVPLLQQLGMLGKTAMLDAIARHPELLTTLQATPPAAADVTNWWAHSSLASHRTLQAVAPQLIGGLEGTQLTRTHLTGQSGNFVGANIQPSDDCHVEAWGVRTEGAESELIGCTEGRVVIGGITVSLVTPLRSDYAPGSRCATAAANAGH